MRRLIISASIVLSAIIPALAMDATSADNLASAILTQLGRSKGVTSIPNCGNGQLVRAFLAASGMKVHAMDSVQANVDATRALIDPTGRIGMSCAIEKHSLATMPYVNRFVDCIVITNLADADLAKVSYAEIERVLAPDGLAFIGRVTSEGSGITQTALQSWINAASKTRSTATVSTSNGTWAVITGTELSGIDVWPKHTYDGNNTNYSKDSVAAFPWMPQAKFKPYLQATYQRPNGGGTTVTSGGRVYEVAPDIHVDGVWGTVPPSMLRVHSIYNGELLWTRDVTNDGLGDLKADPIRAYGRDLYLMRSSGILQLNGITGAEIGTVSSVPTAPQSPLARPTNNDQGCGPYHSSIWYNFNGTGLINWDFHLGKARGGHYYKPPCGVIGTIISNGMMLHMRSSCFCGSSRYSGCNIDGPAGSFTFDRDALSDGSDRVEHGPAWGAIVATVNPDSLDWPMHRANIVHSGASKVSVPVVGSSVHLMWNRRPQVGYVTGTGTLIFDSKSEQEPTPPAVAGGYTFFGGTDGYVRCIDNATNTFKWSYLTGGRICAPPTVANGCVYVGSFDGYAYCLEAHTGRLVWRFRAAPADMRTNYYSYLSSVWPILTGVLVDGSNNAYFAAGIQSEYGTHVYCVNATTGALKWQNNKSATVLNSQERLGVTPSGYMTIFKNRLIMASSVPGNASFDLSTGALDSTVREWENFNATSCSYCENLGKSGYPSNDANRGREVGVVGDTYLMRGGKYVFSDNTFRRSLGYIEMDNGFQAFNANGMPVHPYIKVSNQSAVTPAWDNQSYFQAMTGDYNLKAYALSDLKTVLQSRMSGGITYGWGANDVPDYENGASNSWLPTPAFTNSTLRFNAIVLAPNAIVGTYAKADVLTPENTAWYVGAIDRTAGTTIWEMALPDVATSVKGEPLFQGLAIDRSGDIIVAMRNGNMLCYGTGPVTSVASDLTPQPHFDSAQCGPLRPARGSMDAVPTQAPAAATPAASNAAVAAPAAVTLATQPVGASTSAGVALRPATVVHSSADQQTVVPDMSDMITPVSGQPVHAYAPDVRAAMTQSTGNPVDMTWKPQTPCLDVVSVKASSTSSKPNDACNTLDRDLRTRWTPAKSGAQWVVYDLGKTREVSSVSIVWFAQRRGETIVKIELSTNGKDYQTVDSGVLEGRGTNETLRSFSPMGARFIRVFLNNTSRDAQASLQEVGIHGGMTTGMR
jgi:outer membrane protein assembly factor BamB